MQGCDDHVVLPAAITLRERLCVQDIRQFSVSVARSDYTVSVARYHAKLMLERGREGGKDIMLAPAWSMLSNIIPPFGPMECASELTLTIRTGSFAVAAVLQSVGISSLVSR